MKNTNTKTCKVLTFMYSGGFFTYGDIFSKTGASDSLVRGLKLKGFLEIVGSIGKRNKVVFGITQKGTLHFLNNYCHISFDPAIEDNSQQKKSKFQRLKESITKCYQNLAKLV